MIADDLADRGYEVTTAGDGVEALERIGELRPDVIVLDLILPRSDGWQFAQRYQTLTGGAEIRIVVVSARRSPDLPDAAVGVLAIFRSRSTSKRWHGQSRSSRATSPPGRPSWAPAPSLPRPDRLPLAAGPEWPSPGPGAVVASQTSEVPAGSCSISAPRRVQPAG